MGDRTGIEWTDATWNPQVGCSRVSRGCQHCYAETQAAGRLINVPAYRGVTTDGRFNGKVNLLPERLDQPIRWKRPRRIFVNSMSDLFHEAVSSDWIIDVFATMAYADQHTYQVLTKRPERMAYLMGRHGFVSAVRERREALGLNLTWAWPLPHVWLGVSVESDRFCSRVDVIRDMPAAVRWISAEPLIGPLPSLDLTGIGWLVVGGESGKGAAPMHPDWARDIRARCAAAGVPYLFKQWGEWLPEGQQPASPPPAGSWMSRRFVDPNGENRYSQESAAVRRVGKKAAGRTLDGRTWDEYPEVSR